MLAKTIQILSNVEHSVHDCIVFSFYYVTDTKKEQQVLIRRTKQ